MTKWRQFRWAAWCPIVALAIAGCMSQDEIDRANVRETLEKTSDELTKVVASRKKLQYGIKEEEEDRKRNLEWRGPAPADFRPPPLTKDSFRLRIPGEPEKFRYEGDDITLDEAKRRLKGLQAREDELMKKMSSLRATLESLYSRQTPGASTMHGHFHAEPDRERERERERPEPDRPL
jgi:hypothetical protein